jgi:PQQ-like domain
MQHFPETEERRMRIARSVRAISGRVFNLVIVGCACAAMALAQAPKQGPEQRSTAEREAERRAARAVTVEGRVFDKITGKSVADAIVAWSFDDEHRHSGFTNEQGQFKFLVAHAHGRDRDDRGRDDRDRDRDQDRDVDANGEIVLRTVANLYQPTEQRVQVAAGKTVSVEIGLTPKPPNQIGAVKGTLKNKDSGQPLPKGVVTILGAGERLRTTTAADGSFTIARVGFNPNLTIRFQTPDAPCIEPALQPLEVQNRVVTVNLAVPVLKLPILHCPTRHITPFDKSSGNPPPIDQNVDWRQADILTIQMNADADAWNTGHVNDILKFSDEQGGMLAAADTGGVWAITSISQSFVLSDNWPGTSMTSLALGPDGERDVFAATYPSNSSQGGLLFETDTSAFSPTLNWSQISKAPPCGSINKVLVIPQARRIVLACDSGVYWSPIPPAPSVNGTFTWTNATPANVQQGNAFSGLALGPGWTSLGGEGTIAASKYGGYTPGAAIYYGKWSGGTLTFSASTVQNRSGELFSGIGRSSIASCPSNPSLMFAVAEDGSSNFEGVWKSTDGGINWSLTTFPTNPGGQGSYNQAIAISSDCKITALGWQNGTFISYDGGNSWSPLTNSDGHLHGDVHALTFDPSQPTTLFIGSDGGVASASGLGSNNNPSFRSNWSRQVFDQQIYHADGSSAAVAMVAAGLQDNGVIWAGLPGPWQHVSNCGCDGRWSRFFTPAAAPSGNSILLLEEWGAPDWPYGWTAAHGNSITFQTQQGIPVNPGPPPSLTNVVLSAVGAPRYQNPPGQTMYAAGGIGNQVYGLFGNDDGGNLNWEVIGQIGGSQNVTTAAPTYNGGSVFVGSDQGNIYRLDAPYTGSAVQLTVNTPSGASGGASITALAGFFSTLAYCSVNYGSNGYVMFWNGATWDAVSGNLPNNLPFTSLAGTDINDLYVSTSGPVYDTHDAGSTWNVASNGLPTITQASELRVVADPSGTYLYLASYGRSLWKARLY